MLFLILKSVVDYEWLKCNVKLKENLKRDHVSFSICFGQHWGKEGWVLVILMLWKFCLIVLLKDFNVWISDEICKIIEEKSWM